jgi:O-methyltransferase domain
MLLALTASARPCNILVSPMASRLPLTSYRDFIIFQVQEMMPAWGNLLQGMRQARCRGLRRTRPKRRPAVTFGATWRCAVNACAAADLPNGPASRSRLRGRALNSDRCHQPTTDEWTWSRNSRCPFLQAYCIYAIHCAVNSLHATDRKESCQQRAASCTGVQAMLTGFPWKRFNRSIDVGGSSGSFLAALLQQHDNSSGVLFDLPLVALVTK